MNQLLIDCNNSYLESRAMNALRYFTLIYILFGPSVTSGAVTRVEVASREPYENGKVFDVTVDLRVGSPNFARWRGNTLDGERLRQCYLPPGFGHGFLVLSEFALFHYKCTEYYAPDAEFSVRWNDPDIGIEWPMADPILSERDAAAPLLRDIPPERFSRYEPGE